MQIRQNRALPTFWNYIMQIRKNPALPTLFTAHNIYNYRCIDYTIVIKD